jgi:hypothetical protein
VKTLVSSLQLKGNPFEHYTAETEPSIADYAVRPPYLQRGRRIAAHSFFLGKEALEKALQGLRSIMKCGVAIFAPNMIKRRLLL